MNITRIEEIISGITAFRCGNGVSKEEYLPELKKLQTEIINMLSLVVNV